MSNKNKKLDTKKLNLEEFKGDKNKHISLFNISRYTPYSQEYLSLRARQGKLKAVKIGRDWMTTVNWVDDYLKKVNGKNEADIGKKKIKIALPSKKVLKYSALSLAVICLAVYLSFYPVKFREAEISLSAKLSQGDI